MTDRKPPKGQGPAGKAGKLDLAELRRLVSLMESKGLAEVEMEQEGKRVRVVRAGMGPPVAAFQAALPPSAAPSTSAPKAAADSGGPKPLEVPSPMVGTFYRSPSPDAAPYVEVGDRISRDTVVCIVEAMKVMNEIKAEASGEIIEILVQNGEPVEFGQPLFLLAPPGSAG